MKNIRKECNTNQIKALLRKDVLVRVRQPGMTIVQIVWPCVIFLALYTLRNKFQPVVIDDCQFPTRLLPAKNSLLPFFHSHICTIENQCSGVSTYEEYTTFNNAPLKPVLNVLQIFLNEESLYDAVVDLPEKMNFVSAVTTLATHSKFSVIESNINAVVAQLPQVQKMLGNNFDIKKMFSDSKMFSNSGKIICGRPFPRSDNIRFVENILYTEDFSSINDDELDAMPTKYCKQLYLDITNTNHGKITWNQIKPIIQGKIIYGPANDDTAEIIKHANTTFTDMGRFRKFAESVEITLTKLRIDDEFKGNFLKLLDLVKSPFIQMALGGSVDLDQIEAVVNRIMTDEDIYDIVKTVHNILQCFSADRFIPVNSEKELEEKAFELGKKKLFYAGVYFNKTENNQIKYKIRMDTDNTPITLETRNRIWFPGPEASSSLDLRYHRGFIQIKHAVDVGIIKLKKGILHKQNAATSSKNTDKFDDDNWFSDWDADDARSNEEPNTSVVINDISSNDNEETTSSTEDDIDDSTNSSALDDFITTTESISNPTTSDDMDVISKAFGLVSSTLNSNFDLASLLSAVTSDQSTNSTSDEFMQEMANRTDEDESSGHRTKRQLGGLLAGLFGSKKGNEDKFEIDEMLIYTKQFPYPSYTRDDFKKGLYLAQSVQMAFFIALIVQIATCIRYRIWMRESKNTMLMSSMGLKSLSEVISWITTTFIEILIVFLIACIILYSGGILRYTNFFFILIFLIIFGLSVISFCYMCSTLFTSASIGSVSSSIFFLMTFMPYIVILCLETKLNGFFKFLTNLSLSTAFCYAWDHIMRLELQNKGLAFSDVFSNGFDFEFTYAITMIVVDIFLYAGIGYALEYFKNDEYKFRTVPREDLDPSVGAELQNVSKVYNDIQVAVSNVSITFPKDRVTCLLGRNGAGKSTIIKMLTGQIKPTSGKVVLSQALTAQGDFDKIGLCSQDNILIPHLTAREHLEMYARIKLQSGFDMEVAKTMKSLNFGKYEDYEAYKLSGGYQRRLCVAIAFIGSPNVVILDEPCSGVDTKARRRVWELIEVLRQGRAVILATHYLDEAEYLSDSVFILNNGKTIAQHNPETMKMLFTKALDISITSNGQNSVLEEIKDNLSSYLEKFSTAQPSGYELNINIPYSHDQNRLPEFIEYLETLEASNSILDLTITSKNLEEIFNNLNQDRGILNGNAAEKYEKIDLSNKENLIKPSLSTLEVIGNLLWKRSLHFRRNYRLLLCILILPALFEIIAMSFMQLRPGGEYDTNLNLTRSLYPNTQQFLSLENGNNYTTSTYNILKDNITDCSYFENSALAFKWILDSHDMYHMKRYGGLTFNDSLALVWYNNKGYHSMASWLNDLNSHLLRTEMNDQSFGIHTSNHPLKLGEKELSTSSILQQVADAGVSLILLIAFSLVVAGSSVFIVNERVTGEKLQQKLCGVNFRTYWGVAFVWDFLVFLIALSLCVIIFKIFNTPVYVAKSNLDGICLLLVLYGFASIPAVHVFEKLFAEASFANMTIFCLNVIIALTTLTIVILFDILGESDTSEKWRLFLNRAFLIFPQHALSDGLIEICKNYIVSEVFIRYGIESYKSPVTSDLLRPHYIALVVLGVAFMCINYVIESGLVHKIIQNIFQTSSHTYELKIVSIQNSLKRGDNKYNSYSESYALNVEYLSKCYKRNDYAVKDVSFQIKTGECFGLLGKNGAGKSTIFKILSGQLYQSSGTVNYFNQDISYCPQTSALDPLLTVKELIEFYGRLRRIQDLQQVTPSILSSFHLESYKNVLVKNLSGGNRRKLNVAIACLGDTSVVLMDEPTSDMDPVTRSLVYKAIKELISQKRSVLLTSHTISEIDQVCHRIAVLKDGRIISTGSPEQLKDQFGGYYIITIFAEKVRPFKLQKILQDCIPEAQDIHVHSHTLKFLIKITPKSHEIKNNNIEENSTGTLSLAELFMKLKRFAMERQIQYTITRCRLDLVFEKILDSSDSDGGYVHKAFDQTETVT